MIYCGSGSDTGKVLVPVPAPVSDPDKMKQSFSTQMLQNLAFSMLETS
jgi:hypothetical protein